MKKLISIVLVVCMVLSIGSIALAQTDTAKATQAPKLSRATLLEVRALGQQLRANHLELVALDKELRSQIKQLRAKIAQLKEDKAAITQTQIDSLKATLKSIREERQAFFQDHKNKINDIRPELAQAKKDRNFDEIKACFDKMFAEQEARKADLQKIIDDVKAAIAGLNV